MDSKHPSSAYCTGIHNIATVLKDLCTSRINPGGGGAGVDNLKGANLDFSLFFRSGLLRG